MSRLITPPLTARQLAKEIDVPEADMADAIQELVAKGYLTPLAFSSNGVAWQVNLPKTGGR